MIHFIFSLLNLSESRWLFRKIFALYKAAAVEHEVKLQKRIDELKTGA